MYNPYRNSHRNILRRCLFIFSVVTLVAYMVIRISASAYISAKCGDYFRRAALASDVGTAGRELDRAVLYLEHRGLTHGYTSVFWKSPDEDIGFWYNNVKAMQRNLHAVNPTTPQAAKSVMLIRLKDAILKDNDVISPSGIDIYPYNTWLAGLVIFSFLLGISMTTWWLRDELR